MVLAEGGVGKAGMEQVVVVMERAMPLAEAAKRVRRGTEGVEVDSVDSGVLSLVGGGRGGRGGSAARCWKLVEVEELLAGEGCVEGLWGGGSGEALLIRFLTLVSLAL